MLLPDLKELRQNIKLSKTNDGDGISSSRLVDGKSPNYNLDISAIIIAIQMITKYCKKLKYIRKIVLVTNARGSIDGDGLPDITQKIKDEGIELLVV